MTRIGSRLSRQRRRTRFASVAIGLAAVLAFAIPIASAGGGGGRTTSGSGAAPAAVDPDTAFYVPKPNHGAIEQIADLTSSGRQGDANLISGMIETPQAVWFTLGTPKRSSRTFGTTVQRAAGKGTIPVLVAYNIPFRDCAQFSAGGATTVEEYEAWIDGFARRHR